MHPKSFAYNSWGAVQFCGSFRACLKLMKFGIEPFETLGIEVYKIVHLGFGKHTSRSTLADANSKRDYRIFEEFVHKVVAAAFSSRFRHTVR